MTNQTGLIPHLSVADLARRYEELGIPGAHPADQSRVIVGTLDQVRDEVVRQITVSGANYFIGRFAFGSLTTAQSSNSARLFAEHVMPAARQAVMGQAA